MSKTSDSVKRNYRINSHFPLCLVFSCKEVTILNCVCLLFDIAAININENIVRKEGKEGHYLSIQLAGSVPDP